MSESNSDSGSPTLCHGADHEVIASSEYTTVSYDELANGEVETIAVILQAECSGRFGSYIHNRFRGPAVVIESSISLLVQELGPFITSCI